MAADNGERKPPRPRIELVTSAASPAKAAAVIAAVERFLAETTAVAVTEAAPQSAWLRAALEEGIAARQVTGYAWGHARRR